MQIEPIADRVVVERFKRKTESEGGIALPEHAQEEPIFGRVIAVGPGQMRLQPLPNGELRSPMQCQVGDCVILPGNTYSIELVEGDKDSAVVVIAEGNLLAILPEMYKKLKKAD